MSPPLQIKRVVLLGPARTYEVAFGTGLNVIAGPMFTGKTTILNLIDYAFGAKDRPQYPEILKCPEVYVETLISGELLTIERSLQNENARATIHYGTVEEARNRSVESLAVLPAHQGSTPSISTEVLQRLGLEDVQIKRAPTKEASEVASYSIRGLFRFVNLSQARMAQDYVFFENEFVKSNEWHQGFEILHGLHSPIESHISRSLEHANRQEAELQQFLRSAEGFLDGAKVPDAPALEGMVTELSAQHARLRAELEQVKTDSEAVLGEDLALVRQHESLSTDRDRLQSQGREVRRALDPLGRLKVQYGREQAQLEFLAESEVVLGRLPVVRCPACLKPIDTSPSTESKACHLCHGELQSARETVPVENRLRAVRRRLADLDDYVKELQGKTRELDLAVEALGRELHVVDSALERIRSTTLFPQSRKQLEISETISLLEQKLAKAKDQLELRRRSAGEGSRLLAIQQMIRKLQADREQAMANKRSPDAVVLRISELFVETLAKIRFPELRGTSIDRQTYRPLVRDQPYTQLRSKAAIAFVLTSFHLALVRYALEAGSLHPRLLLLDSPLSHVGRDSGDEAFRDQQIVDAFYATLLELVRESGSEFQIVLVDNRPPDAVRAHIAVEFSGVPGQGRYGLIDDEMGGNT